MYADDVVLMAETEQELQDMLSVVQDWMLKWHISLNLKKSKCVHFRPQNVERTEFDFKINNKSLEITSTYKYLGLYFHEHLDFNENALILSQSANRALGSIISKYKSNKHMGFSTYSKLYHACVLPILNYSSGVWGYKRYSKTDGVHQLAMRVFLGVHKFAPISALYCDTGWLKPQYHRWADMIRLWNRLLKIPQDRITRKIFEIDYDRSHTTSNWSSKVKDIFSLLDLEHIFNLKLNCDMKVLMDKLTKYQSNQLLLEIGQKPKLRFYREFKDNCDSEKYISYNLTSSERSILAQLRFGILPIKIETGRFVNIPAEERFCDFCKTLVEDEWHFIYNCELYNEERTMFFNSLLNLKPDFVYFDEREQLKYLFKEKHRMFAKFIKSCFEKRKASLFS